MRFSSKIVDSAPTIYTNATSLDIASNQFDDVQLPVHPIPESLWKLTDSANIMGMGIE